MKHIFYVGAAVLSTALCMSSASAQSLYSDLGGKAGVAKFVESAVERWQKNPVLAAQFKNTNASRLREQLEDQFCALAGGGCTYEGGDMKKVHANMGVTTAQFNALAEDLQEAMTQHNVPNAAQNRLVALLAPMKRDVVTR